MSDKTSTPISGVGIVSIAKPYRIQFEEAQNCWVLLYPEGMVKLNGSAGEILKRCDGVKNIDTVTQELEVAFEQKDLQKDVVAFIAIALEKRWITISEYDSNGQ